MTNLQAPTLITHERWQLDSAHPEDAAGIAQVRASIWRESQVLYGVNWQDAADRIGDEATATQKQLDKIADPAKLCTVARVSGKVVGYCMATREEDVNRVNSFYVLAGHRNLGLGGILFNGLLPQIRDKDVVVDTHIHNRRAQVFYRRLGFEPTGVVKDSEESGAILLASGAVFPELEMKLAQAHMPADFSVDRSQPVSVLTPQAASLRAEFDSQYYASHYNNGQDV